MSSLKLSMGDSIKGLQAGDRRPSWCSLPATSRTSPQTRGSGHDHGSASALSAWNQQPTTVATIARIGSHNGAKFSQWCTRIHADTPRAQSHGCARCVRGEFVDTAEMTRRFGLSGAHLRGLLRATLTYG